MMASGRLLASVTPEDALSILQKNSFKIVNKVSDIPRQPVVAANMIAPSRTLSSFIVNKNEEFQRGDASIDPDKPQRQIIFGGLSNNYLFLCFWKGGQVESRYFILLSRQGATAKVIFYCSLDGNARNLSDVKRLIRANQISMLTFEPDR